MQIAVGFIGLIAACTKVDNGNYQEILMPPAQNYVISLNENMPEIEKIAREWHTDSYLLSLSLPVGFTNYKGYQYNAHYASPSDSLTLGLTKMVDGSMMKEYYPQGNESPEDAIKNSDWKFDSLEIFDLAYKYFASEYLSNESENICGEMVLRRNPNMTDNPIVWRVYFEKCTPTARTPLGNIILDPITGADLLIRHTTSP